MSQNVCQYSVTSTLHVHYKEQCHIFSNCHSGTVKTIHVILNTQNAVFTVMLRINKLLRKDITREAQLIVSLTQFIRTSPTLSVVPSGSLWSRKPATSSVSNKHTNTTSNNVNTSDEKWSMHTNTTSNNVNTSDEKWSMHTNTTSDNVNTSDEKWSMTSISAQCFVNWKLSHNYHVQKRDKCFFITK